MLRQAPKAAAVLLFVFCCFFPPAAAHAQDQPYSAPVVLLLTVPGAAEPITVTAQIVVTLPAGAASSAPLTLPLTITQAASSQGSVKVISAASAKPVEGGPAVPLTPGAALPGGLLATPTPQPAASAASVPTPQPVAGTVSDAANLRSGPGTSYAVVGKAQAGDSVSVVGRSADGEWYKLADGEWIAAFLLDVKGADSLPVADAPSAADSWPRYEMITGDFSFAYPPQFSVSEEEETSVLLTAGSGYYTSKLEIFTLQADVAPISDHEAAVRQLKTMLTQINNFDHRFLDDGVIDAERGGVYVTGVASQDDVDLAFMTALVPVDTSYMFALYLHYGSADIAAEALPIITEIARSIQVPSSTSAATAAAAPSGVEAADQPSLGGSLPPTLAATPAAASDAASGSAVLSGVGAAALNRFMTGSAVVPLPTPTGADFDVIELGRTDHVLYLWVRNNTDAPVQAVSVNTVVRNANGEMLAVEESLSRFEPKVIQPGEVAYGLVVFSDFTFPNDAAFSYEVNWSQATNHQFYGNLTVAEVNLVGNRFVGMLRNDTVGTVTGPIEAHALCFDREGAFLFAASDYTINDEVEAGGSIPFEIKISDSCPYYLVFAAGFQE